jgi:hypothetical protein
MMLLTRVVPRPLATPRAVIHHRSSRPIARRRPRVARVAVASSREDSLRRFHPDASESRRVGIAPERRVPRRSRRVAIVTLRNRVASDARVATRRRDVTRRPEASQSIHHAADARVDAPSRRVERAASRSTRVERARVADGA